jgi:ribonuclease BN (tRNA processing enzyme)
LRCYSKFLFDGGTGSGARIGSLHIPYDYINKIFISHLHTDHFGDFAAYFIGGRVAGRQGQLTLAEDYMVWNVTKDKITTRMIAYNEDVWPPPAPQPPPPVDRSITKYTSDWITEKNLDVTEIVNGIYDRANKMYGTNEKPNQ